LYMAGFDPAEVSIIKKMNTDVKAKVDTPFGITKEISIKEAVRQGSVFGTTLCAVETDTINRINERAITTIGPTLIIESMIFVDDIMGAGSWKCIEKLGRNLLSLEKLKKFTFNQQKSKIIKLSKTKSKEIPNVNLSKGKISITEQEKYLGDWISSKNDNNIRIEKKRRKNQLHDK